MTSQQKKDAQLLLQKIQKFAEAEVQTTPFGIFVEVDIRGKFPSLAVRVLEQPKVKSKVAKVKGSK